MIREELRDISIDGEYLFDSYFYDYDQAYVSCPVVFPTVRFQLEDTHGLNALADAIRKENGVLPLYDDTGEYNDRPWYSFQICLNGFNDHHIDTSIYVCVEPEDEVEDDFVDFYIDLSEEEQIYVYCCIDKALRPETSCEQELRSAAEYWELDWRCPA